MRGNRQVSGANEGVGFGQLVVGQGFGGKEVEGAGGRPFQDTLQDGNGVAEGFAGGSRGGGDDVAPLGYGRDSGCLMRK